MREFPPFRLDPVNQCLWRRRDGADDERILLSPKAYSVLLLLVDHAGRLVTQEEILDAIWKGVHVQPQVVKSHILEIRAALGDSAQHPHFVETLHRRGYRFVATVEEGAEARSPVPPKASHRRVVGRERELGELEASLEKAVGAERQIVFITGEPGIGKTALADEFQRRAVAVVSNLSIARGQCIEGYGGKEAYYPMLEALSDLCRGPGGEAVVQILAAQAPTWLVQFPALIKQEQREAMQREILGATRERMLREMGDALESIAAIRPLLIIFEDLHWVDYSTVDLISALARRRAPARLTMIVTKRPLEMVQPGHPLQGVRRDLVVHQLCREIFLQPLTEGEIAQYLAAESEQARVPQGLAKLLYHHSEGNPLFMVAALEQMTEQRFVTRESGVWKLQVPLQEIALDAPERLLRMIEVQMDRLTPEEQRALESASVAGIAFLPAVCAAAANLDPEAVEDLCHDLARRYRIVRPAASLQIADGSACSRYEFTHALYREVFYRRLGLGRRTTLHQRIGEQLETLFSDRLSEAAPELAQHFERASDWQRASKYLLLAAETARRRYANREATAVLQHALDLSSKLPKTERAVREIEILEKLGMIYASEYDPRAIESYEGVASRAARLGLLDVEARALINLAYPLAWFSSERCLKVLDRALLLSNSQQDPLMRATTRMLALHYQVWAGGWNPGHAEQSRDLLNEIRKVGDPITVLFYLAVYALAQWASSDYREAAHNLSEAVSNLLDTSDDYLNLSLTVWIQQLFSSSSLLFLGEWGEALRGFNAGIAMLEKNGDEYRAKTLRLYLAWAHLHAMDFEGALRICETSFPHPEDFVLDTMAGSSNALPEEARISLIIRGSALSALGDLDLALKNLLTARSAMDQQMVIIDWYWRMQLQSSLAQLWLEKGDLKQARIEAERFLEVTLTTAERTWQALAWEANARVAMAQRDLDRAKNCIAKALSTMEGFEVPLAAWRVHATASEVFDSKMDKSSTQHHREQSRAIIDKLASSLPPEDPLRETFLSSAIVRAFLAPTENDTIKPPKKGGMRLRRKAI